MKKPTAEQLTALFVMGRQNSVATEYLTAWRNEELEQLPFASNSVDVQRGRVQVLTEIQKLLGLRS